MTKSTDLPMFRASTNAPVAMPLFWAALAIGSTYLYAVLAHASGPGIVLWKAGGVAMLALWAGMQARSTDGWMLAALLALGAAGDTLLETHGLETGAVAFALGHVVSIALYLRHRRANRSGSQKALALLVVPLSVWIVSHLLPASVPGAMGAWFYTGLVATMAATAWISRFSRLRVGVGAMMFLISDLLIFGRESGAVASSVAQWLIWPLYFGGQTLIAWGVAEYLRGRTSADDVWA